jgi:hypothetical protein
MAENEVRWILFSWDIYDSTNMENEKLAKAIQNSKSIFYRKLSGYKTRSYREAVDSNEAVAKRLQGYSFEEAQDLPSSFFPDGIDGVSSSGKLYKIYEYEGVIHEIPPDERIRLNDSNYVVSSDFAFKIRELILEFEEIFKSAYEIEIAEWESIVDIKPESQKDFDKSLISSQAEKA